MYCNQCGNNLSDDASFCPNCGNKMGVNQSIPQQTIYVQNPNPYYQGVQTPHYQQSQPYLQSFGGGIGYSSRINDPAFAKYIKAGKQWAGIFGVIMACIAVIGFYIAGELGDELDNPAALMYGCIIGGMFLIISLFTVLGKNKGSTWDGVVYDKKIEKKRRRVNTNDDDSYMQNYTVYTVFIRSNDGKSYEIRIEDNDSRYNYFQIGDYVRHHKGLNSYEKYDKSRDSIIFCNACATMNPISEDRCRLCKCPLLK